MTRRAPAAALLLFLAAAAARAQDPDANGPVIPPTVLPPGVQASTDTDAPPYLRWMLEPRKNGIFVRLPIVDTDPNRGTTYGVMPILVLQDPNTNRITQIHAPSLTYNANFGIEPTYRWYYYPTTDATLSARASWSKYEREAFGEYSDQHAFGTQYDLYLLFQYNVDAGQQFYGLGPDSSRWAQTNYKQEYWQYKWGIGKPLAEGSNWRAHIGEHYESSRALDGPLPGLPGFDATFPAQFSDRYQQTHETRVTLDYDTRDSVMTTTHGAFAQAYAEASLRGFMSEYDYERYGADLRWFHPWKADDDSKVLAVQYQFQQVMGPTPPFWILPTLGGKYSLRAYGDGRFVDRGMTALNVEQRFNVLQENMAGVTAQFQIAPFAGLGGVFDAPTSAQLAYVRPVVGSAFRVVVKPQVVGSVDVGYGQEGAAVFMDINYSF